MAADADQASHAIGDWTFHPASHELVRGPERVRLEHRASDVLAMLCERRGEVVSREAILARVWNGRHVSPNSLPTVIHDLRRALGDDARRPRFVETLSKAGYRLICDREAAAVAIPVRRRPGPAGLAAAGLGAAAIAVLAAVAWPRPAPAPVTVVLDGVRNATGDPAYDMLARASEGVLLTELGRRPGLRIRRAGAGPGRTLRFTARLVLWSGLPDVTMTAEDAADASVVWSGFAFGPEPTLPGKIRQKVDAFAAAVAAAKR